MLKKESLHNRRISIVNKSKIIKDSIEKVIEFLNILIELENNHNIEKKEEFQLSVESYLPEEIEEIKNLTIEEEKIKEIEKIYINEGKNIEYIQRIYENVKD